MLGKNKMKQNTFIYLSIVYGPISLNFDKRLFRFPDMQGYANSKELERQGHI